MAAEVQVARERRRPRTGTTRTDGSIARYQSWSGLSPPGGQVVDLLGPVEQRVVGGRAAVGVVADVPLVGPRGRAEQRSRRASGRPPFFVSVTHRRPPSRQRGRCGAWRVEREPGRGLDRDRLAGQPAVAAGVRDAHGARLARARPRRRGPAARAGRAASGWTEPISWPARVQEEDAPRCRSGSVAFWIRSTVDLRSRVVEARDGVGRLVEARAVPVDLVAGGPARRPRTRTNS